jgi:predicted transcriptional regulator
MWLEYPQKDSSKMKFSDLKALLEAMTRQEANALADSANVPQSTVAKIRKGHTQEPRITTVEALSKALANSGARVKKHMSANAQNKVIV